VGDRLEASALVAGHGDEVRARLQRCVAALQRMVDGGWFAGHDDTVGMEVEFDLVDPLGRPRLINDAVLARLGRADMQHELGQFNIELNMDPRRLQGRVLHELERDLADVFDTSRAGIERLGARLVAVGMLPTLSAEQLTVERISDNPRYALLCRRMRAARHRPFRVRILDGCEPVEFTTDSVAPEAAATSLQLHLRVPPERFAAYYNAAQMIAGAQVAVAANSPYLLARQVWQETRITLLEQLLDTRRRREARAGAPARVRLGDRWVDGPVELFDDLVRLFPPLFPTLDAEDPDAALQAGCAPGLGELRLHNGTVWRWNRPVYDVQDGCPQLRIENRVLPSLADRPLSTWSPTPRSTTGWSARSPTATPPRGGGFPSRSPSGTCTARHAPGWPRSCAGSAATTRSTGSPVRSCCRPPRPASTPGGWPPTTATGTSVSSKRGFDAAAPALSGRPRRCATSRSTGCNASRRCVR